MVSIRKDIDQGFVFPVDYGETKKSYTEFLDDNLTETELAAITLEWNDLKKVKNFGVDYSFGGYVLNKPIYNCITASYGKTTGNSTKFWRGDSLTVLTPKECWRLMGFTDEDYSKAEKVCKAKDLYHQAGNSIVVNVLEELIKGLNLPTEITKMPEKSKISSWLDALLA